MRTGSSQAPYEFCAPHTLFADPDGNRFALIPRQQ
jgi:hypothetical protein